MVDLPESEAKHFLEYWGRNLPERPPAEMIINAFFEFTKLINKEYKEFELGEEEKLFESTVDGEGGDRSVEFYDVEVQKIKSRRLGYWMLLVGGIKALLYSKEKNCQAANELFSSLGDLARADPSVDAFKIKRTSKIRPMEELWIRARIIAAHELYPDQKDEILTRGSSLLNLQENKIKKIIENYSHGREPRSDLTNLVAIAKKHHKESATTNIGQILY